jgi:hypothetical protein
MQETLSRLVEIWVVGLAHHNPAAVAVFGLLFWLMVRIVARPRRRSYRVRSRAYDPFRSRPVPPSPSPSRRVIVRPEAPARPPRYRLPGHAADCRCGLCNPASAPLDPAAVAFGRAPGTDPYQTRPAVMPEPSDAVAPAEHPCRHQDGVEAVVVGTELMRFTCANWRCEATWPPDAKFPAGTVIRGGGR